MNKDPNFNNKKTEEFKFRIDKIQEEMNSMRNDFNEYGSGAFLWVKEKYPLALKMNPNLEKIISSFKFLPDMKDVVDEYFKFIRDVEQKSSLLYEEEMNYSREQFFEKTISPLDMMVARDPLIKYTNREMSQSLKKLKPQYNNHYKQLSSEMKKISEKIKNQNEEMKKTNEALKSEKNPLKLLQDLAKNLTKGSNDLKEIFGEFNKLLTKEKKENIPDLEDVNKNFKKLTADFKKIQDDSTKSYRLLTHIKAIDSFHIRFTKFIARLYYIFSHDNRNFEKNIPHFEISQKKFISHIRSKLSKFLESDLNVNYPLLTEFLLMMLKFNKFRNLDSHENPPVRISNNKAYFVVPGENEEIEMDFEEIGTIVNTYGFFIKSLCLIKNYTP